MSRFTFVAVCAAMTVPLFAQASCDAVLTESYQRENRSSKYQYAWLYSITESTYTKAKESAGASFANLFSGDYNSFRSKLATRMVNEKISVSSEDAYEILKGGLTPEQINAWSKCKSNDLQLAVSYRDVTSGEVTLVLTWQRQNEFVPVLTDITFDLRNAAVENSGKIEQIDGTRSVVLTRTDVKSPIRGTVTAKASANGTTRTVQAYVYVAPESVSPPKRIVPIKDVVYESVGYWERGAQHQVFYGPPPPSDQDRIILEKVEINIGNRKGEYVNDAAFCNHRTLEFCVERIIKRGCFINKAWHNWYKDNVVVYKPEDVCEG